jgi:Zn-dependent metalloprotease
MQLITHEDKNGEFKRINGSYAHDIELDIPEYKSLEPELSKDDVMDYLISETAANMNKNQDEIMVQNEDIELVIYIDDHNNSHLAYYVNFFADGKFSASPTRPYFIIDADTEEILKKWEGLTDAEVGTGPGGTIKTGEYEYGTDYGYLDVAVNGSIYTMENEDVLTVDLEHATTDTGSTPYSYNGPRNTHEYINGGYCPLNDAHYFGGVTLDMYNNWFGVDPLPFQIVLKVHYKNSYENAFWNGAYSVFGDGAFTYYPFSASVNIVAHEVSHGFTEDNSDLIYENQSGGINEAFSDIAGEAAEYFLEESADFEVGAEITKAEDEAIRYMHDPPLDGNSIDDIDDYYSGMDPHFSSGLFNKAFYTLATTSGWNVQKASEVFVHANQNYWEPDNTFLEGTCGVIESAVDLEYNYNDVDNAFEEIGINCCVGTCEVAYNSCMYYYPSYCYDNCGYPPEPSCWYTCLLYFYVNCYLPYVACLGGCQ